ncbi:right-handed parallel beta-helix repeat-containing protein [Candidatus Desantisbacteria bacterium]|nr:right-handed parallel beta-helix repeat-containing protein [Candidatus Desantisbacteria bacterium]
MAGTYTEAVYINKGIALIGAGQGVCTITAQGKTDTNTVTFDGEGADGALISGFIITGATQTVGDMGAGIYCCNGAEPIIANNIITNNGDEGIRYRDASGTATNNIISKNGGDGICCNNSFPSITNNIITGNNRDGICCNNSSPFITNCIISDNNTGDGRGGISCNDNSSPTITNNIITENGITSADYYGIYDASGTPIINYNDVWGNGEYGNNNYATCTAGSNDISLDPQFIDTSTGNYRLGTNSPCIDAGSNTAAADIPTDKDGHPRIFRIVDMGAYEFTGNFLQIRLLTPTEGPVDTIVTIQGNTSATDILISIDFGTHQTITTSLSSDLGTFSATFTVDAQGSGTKVITVSSGSLLLTFNFSLLTSVFPPCITLTKEGTQTPEGTITYTITYTNTGEGTATNVILYDFIPEGIEFIGTVTSPGTLTYSHDGGMSYDDDSTSPVTTLKWEIDPIAPTLGGTIIFTVRIKK